MSEKAWLPPLVSEFFLSKLFSDKDSLAHHDSGEKLKIMPSLPKDGEVYGGFYLMTKRWLTN
jgi:hypothetical protein